MSDLHGSLAAIIKMCFIVKAPRNVWAKSIIHKLALKKKTEFSHYDYAPRLIKYTSSLFLSSSHLFLTWKILPMQHERIQSVTNKWWMRVEMKREWWVYAEKGRREKKPDPSRISRCTSSQPLTSTMQRCNKGEVNRQYPNSASTKLAAQ